MSKYSIYEIKRHTLLENRIDHSDGESVVNVAARSYQEAHDMARGVVDCAIPDKPFEAGHQFLTARMVRSCDSSAYMRVVK